MENETKDEVIVDDVEENNEEVEETTEVEAKAEKPKRTPQEELEYFEGRAARLRKKLGVDKKAEPAEIESKKAPPGKPNELDYGQKAFLKSYGIAGSDELTLVKQFQERGFDLDAIVSDDVFTSKLTKLREAKESTDAIPKGKGRSGQTYATDIDVAVAKYKDTGEFPSDFATRNKVIDIITKEEKGDIFSGPSVIK